MNQLSIWFQVHRYMALGGLVAVLCFYLFATDVLPRVAEGYMLYQRWKAQEAQLASVENWDVEQIALSIHKRRLQERFADLYVSLPRSDQMSTLLQVLQESADAEGITVSQVHPTERAQFAHYDLLPFEVDVEGTFHAVARFVNRIEQSSYVIKVSGLALKRPAATSKTLRASLVLSVIILKEQGGAP